MEFPWAFSANGEPLEQVRQCDHRVAHPRAVESSDVECPAPRDDALDSALRSSRRICWESQPLAPAAPPVADAGGPGDEVEGGVTG